VALGVRKTLPFEGGALSPEELIDRVFSSELVNDTLCQERLLGGKLDVDAARLYLDLPVPLRPEVSVFFDRRYYGESYPDIELAGLDPFLHFFDYGYTEGRSPHPLIEPKHIRTADEHLLPSNDGINRLYQVLLYNLANPSPYFVLDHYRTYITPADDVSAGLLAHFLTYGIRKGWRPNPLFDPVWYAAHQMNPPGDPLSALRDFVLHGDLEGRPPSPAFSGRKYLERHTDVAEARTPPLAHYLTLGKSECRKYFCEQEEYTDDEEEKQAKIQFRTRARNLLPAFSRRPISFDTGGVPVVSVIMAVRDNFSLTLQALTSLRDNFAGTIQVILVDCGSTDETKFIERYVRGVVVLRFERNLGFVRACNAALVVASADAVLYLNNDVELAPGAVAAALERLTSDPHIGAVGGKVIRSHGRLQEAGCIIWRDGTTRGYMRDALPLRPEVNFVRDVDYCSAVFLLVRSAPLRELGGFDEAFAPAYYEDTNLCVRLRQSGYRVVYDPAVIIHHLEYGTSGDELPIEQVRENQRTFLTKNVKWLEAQHEPDVTREVFARSAVRNERRLLFVEDTVPMRMMGAGNARSNDLIRLMAELGWQVTVHPVEQKEPDPAAVYADFPDTIEVMYDRSLDDFEEFLRARVGYYDTIWIARTHNLDRAMPMLQRTVAVSDLAPRLILDTEAIVTLREAERARLADPTVPFDINAAISQEFANRNFCQHFIAVSEHEAATLRTLGLDNVSVIGHMREVALTPREWKNRSGLLFVGAVHALDSPNYDSLVWLVETVLPIVQQALGWQTRLTVVGYTGADVSLERFGDHPRVSLLGAVADMRPIYDAHRVFVAPTRFAAGIPYKVHEAASFGIPVVASELLRRQLGWKNDHELLAADVTDPEAFAQHIISLYQSEALWSRIRAAAAERVRQENDPTRYRRLVSDSLTRYSPPQAISTPEL
jgi:GT2 family glycosyltransferase/glycosyltransferase involved in cell wall biosynthesis